MRLNHIGLSVTDVRAAAQFLVQHFGMSKVGKVAKDMGHVVDEQGTILSLFEAERFGVDISPPESTHIGFMQGTREVVDTIHARLVAAGLNPPAPVDTHGYTLVITAPGGFAVEVVA
jgi:catechol 2,3-dioxygenase-like lactoylglutathione lyase family enzyme